MPHADAIGELFLLANDNCTAQNRIKTEQKVGKFQYKEVMKVIGNWQSSLDDFQIS